MTDPYGRDNEDGIPRREFTVDKDVETIADLEAAGEHQLKDLTETLMEGHEEALVKSLFRQIREHTVTEEDKEESRPNVSMHEEPPDVEDMEFEDWFVPAGCIRVDAAGTPISVDLLVDAIEAARREGNYPRDNEWEFWLHHEQLHVLRDGEDYHEWQRHETVAESEYNAEVHGIGVRALPVFPTGAILLLDPRVLEPEHGVGDRAAQGVVLKDPRRVVRVTSVARKE